MKFCTRAFILWNQLLLTDLYFVQGKQSWTRWLNVDSPADGVENETLARIRKVEPGVCNDKNPTDVLCRIAGSSYTFSNKYIVSSNLMIMPCNLTGVVCVNREQIDYECPDFEIRFFCHKPDEESDSDYDGGFIAMAAGLSVICPLVCVLIVQLKRAKANQCRTQASTAQPSTSRTTTAVHADLPPTYEQLFGEETMQRCDSRTVLIQNGDLSLLHDPEDVRSSQTNQSNVSISTISGSDVGDVASDSQDGSSLSDTDYPDNTTVTIETETDNGSRRLPGIHISIHDLMTTYCGPDNLTPPPTYNEALKILSIIQKEV